MQCICDQNFVMRPMTLYGQTGSQREAEIVVRSRKGRGKDERRCPGKGSMTSARCVVRKVPFKGPITFLCVLQWILPFLTFNHCESLKSVVIIVCYLSLMFATSCAWLKY
jgi:hypothetical protein